MAVASYVFATTREITDAGQPGNVRRVPRDWVNWSKDCMADMAEWMDAGQIVAKDGLEAAIRTSDDLHELVMIYREMSSGAPDMTTDSGRNNEQFKEYLQGLNEHTDIDD
jgi:hypothetical protein